MPTDTVLPQSQRQHGNYFFFQQDGAPPHCAVTVHQFLDEQLPNKWRGRRGPVEWPPRSPNLTPIFLMNNYPTGGEVDEGQWNGHHDHQTSPPFS